MFFLFHQASGKSEIVVTAAAAGEILEPAPDDGHSRLELVVEKQPIGRVVRAHIRLAHRGQIEFVGRSFGGDGAYGAMDFFIFHFSNSLPPMDTLRVRMMRTPYGATELRSQVDMGGTSENVPKLR